MRDKHLLPITRGARELDQVKGALFGLMNTEWWAWDELDGGALTLDLGLRLASLLKCSWSSYLFLQISVFSFVKEQWQLLSGGL